jgi:molybdenum cofactor guanylyltransferase
VDDVGGFVLAGGKSARMGADKALLLLDGENLLQRALRTVAAVVPNPTIVGDPVRYASFGEVIEDRIPGCGPLGGIHAAMYNTGSDRNLVLSVDMPLMTAEFLGWLLEQSVNGTQFATLPRPAGRTQPLCAVYRREMLPTIEQALAAREYKVDRVFTQVPTRYLSDSEIRAAGFSEEIFLNVNTPEDFELLKHHIAKGGPASAEVSSR